MIDLKMISIRLDTFDIDRIKKFAEDKRMGYQTYIRMIIRNHIDEKVIEYRKSKLGRVRKRRPGGRN